MADYLQRFALEPEPVEFLKVPLRSTFKNFTGFYHSAKCCTKCSLQNYDD
jgi:hypothetical protein